MFTRSAYVAKFPPHVTHYIPPLHCSHLLVALGGASKTQWFLLGAGIDNIEEFQMNNAESLLFANSPVSAIMAVCWPDTGIIQGPLRIVFVFLLLFDVFHGRYAQKHTPICSYIPTDSLRVKRLRILCPFFQGRHLAAICGPRTSVSALRKVSWFTAFFGGERKLIHERLELLCVGLRTEASNGVVVCMAI